jgi:hypothetical protein
LRSLIDEWNDHGKSAQVISHPITWKFNLVKVILVL